MANSINTSVSEKTNAETQDQEQLDPRLIHLFSKLDAIDKRLDSNNQRLDSNNQRLDSVITQLTEHQQSTDEVRVKAEAVNFNLEATSNTLREIALQCLMPVRRARNFTLECCNNGYRALRYAVSWEPNNDTTVEDVSNNNIEIEDTQRDPSGEPHDAKKAQEE